ncbi:sugar porter family MFS transporter [Chitinophaga lutea]
MKKQLYVPLISLVAAFGGLLFGFDIAVFSGTIPFIQPYYGLDEAALGWTGSSLYVGCFAGSLVTGALTDRFGRKLPLIVSALIFSVSSIMMGWAGSYEALIAWRMLAGVAVGAASILSPLYIAEVSPAAVRGRMVSVNQLTIVIGILLAYLSNYLLAGTEDNWRWMFSAGAVPAALFFICVFFVPESPRWLYTHGRKAEAVALLQRISGEAAMEAEIGQIEKSMGKDAGGRWQDLWKKGVRGVVLLGIVIAVFQQISGANAVFFYAPIIFGKAGMNVNDQLMQQILVGVTNLLFTLVAMRLVDRWGRRRLMQGGALMMAVWLLVIGLCYYFNFFSGWWLTGFVMAFIATYATSLAPVTWVLISEIFPNKVRGMAMAVATSSLWAACFALAYGFPVLIAALSPHETFFLFSGICLLYFLILRRFVPETGNKTLEEIEMTMAVH